MSLVLVDSSIWIDHIRQRNPALIDLIAQDRVLQHRLITAELALGSLARRDIFIAMLERMRQAEPASHARLLAFVSQRTLHGTGIGVIDAHLLLCAERAAAQLWTRDRRLNEQAQRLGVAYPA